MNSLLNGTADDGLASALDAEILDAGWLIFAMLDVDVANYESSDAVKQFLRLRSDRLPGSKLVVLALNEPYFFDSTEIGKNDRLSGRLLQDPTVLGGRRARTVPRPDGQRRAAGQRARHPFQQSGRAAGAGTRTSA